MMRRKLLARDCIVRGWPIVLYSPSQDDNYYLGRKVRQVTVKHSEFITPPAKLPQTSVRASLLLS